VVAVRDLHQQYLFREHKRNWTAAASTGQLPLHRL
jgi:hypothetical protein